MISIPECFKDVDDTKTVFYPEPPDDIPVVNPRTACRKKQVKLLKKPAAVVLKKPAGVALKKPAGVVLKKPAHRDLYNSGTCMLEYIIIS